MNNYCVYKHTTPSGKVYIGITYQRLTKRWKNGRGYEGCTAFYRAIQKYGWANIKHEILAENLEKDAACEMEQRLIAELKSYDPEHGYNLTMGGEHYEPTQAWRDALSKSNKEYYKRHPEARERIGDLTRGRTMSDEEKAKQSERMKRYVQEHPEHRERCRNLFLGKKRSEEFCRKLGERVSKPVVCLETGVKYKSVKAAADAIGVHRTAITNVLHGRAKTSGGYTFAFCEEGNNEQ